MVAAWEWYIGLLEKEHLYKTISSFSGWFDSGVIIDECLRSRDSERGLVKIQYCHNHNTTRKRDNYTGRQGTDTSTIHSNYLILLQYP